MTKQASYHCKRPTSHTTRKYGAADAIAWRAAMREKKWSPNKLAKDLNISPTTVQKVLDEYDAGWLK